MIKKLLTIVFAVVFMAPLLVQAKTDQRISDADLECLTTAAWNEARGRPEIEIVAVMHVILNRTAHPSFGNTICSVVLAKGQFQMSDKLRNSLKRASSGKGINRAWKETETYADMLRECAIRVLSGDTTDPTFGATHFYSPKLRLHLRLPKSPSWAKRMPLTASLGAFRFHILSS